MKIRARQLELILYRIENIVKQRDFNENDINGVFKDVKKNSSKEVINEFKKFIRILIKPLTFNRLGKFVVVTGIDKSGKETQTFNPKKKKNIMSVNDYLLKRKFSVYKIFLPSYNTLPGSLIASYLGKEHCKIRIIGELSSDIAWILWAIDRAQYNNDIANWLSIDKKNIVLSKRWVETNIAYQIPQNIDKDRMLSFERNIIKQDNTIVIDVKLDEIMKRLHYSSERADKYEEYSFLYKVNEIYKNMEKYYPYGHIHNVNGNGSIKNTNIKIIENIYEIFFSD